MLEANRLFGSEQSSIWPPRPRWAKVLLLSTLLLPSACNQSHPPSDLIGERIHCIIDTLDSRTVLRADTSITLDQPDLFYFAVDSRGATYGSPVRGGGLLHWSAEGTMLPMVGSTGEGPGQFASGPVVPFVTNNDTLYARDNHRHWVVFGPDGQFVRFQPTGPISASSLGATQFTGDGSVLSSDQNGSEQYSLLLVSRSGDVVRRIRPLGSPNAESSPLRAAVTPGDGTYWVGPEIYSRGAYSVELWDSTGAVLRSLHRSVPWYVADSLIRPFKKNERKSATDPRSRPFLFPRVQQLVWGDGGKLWIVTHVPKSPTARDEMMSARTPAAMYAAGERVLEKHVEVLDPSTGDIIASTVFASGFTLMPMAHGGVLVTEDSATGLRSAVRYSMRLIESSGGACK